MTQQTPLRWNVPVAFVHSDSGCPRSQSSDISLIDLETPWAFPGKNAHLSSEKRATRPGYADTVPTGFLTYGVKYKWVGPELFKETSCGCTKPLLRVSVVWRGSIQKPYGLQCVAI